MSRTNPEPNTSFLTLKDFLGSPGAALTPRENTGVTETYQGGSWRRRQKFPCDRCQFAEDDYDDVVCSITDQFVYMLDSCPLPESPLSSRILDFITDHPGSTARDVMDGVLDYRKEKPSDAERILIVLCNSGKVYTVDIWNEFHQKLVPRYYAWGAIPV